MSNRAAITSVLKRNKVSLTHYPGCCFVALSSDNCCSKTDFSWFVFVAKKLQKKEKGDALQNILSETRSDEFFFIRTKILPDLQW